MMLWQSPPAISAPAPVLVQQELFQTLRQQAVSAPEVALAQAAALRSPELRDRVERLAFLTLADRNPAASIQLLPRYIERDWIGEVGLPRAVPAAREVPAELGRKYTLAAVRANPMLAIREVTTYSDVPYAAALFDEAVRLAPDEAVAVSIGGSPTAHSVREVLARSSRPEVRLLALLAADGSLPEADRPKLAWLAPDITAGKVTREQAVLKVRRDPEYFHTLVQLRLAAGDPLARSLDRTIETYALMLLRSMRDDSRAAAAAELERFSARDLRILAAYGRAEDTEETFAVLFDRYLLPKLRQASRTDVLDAPQLHLRVFLAMALAHARLDAFLPAARRTEILRGVFSGLDRETQPAVEAIALSELMEGTTDRSVLVQLGTTIAGEYQRVRAGNSRVAAGYYGLLAARLARHMERLEIEAPPALTSLAARYDSYLREDRGLDSAALFDAQGHSIQVQFFYDDEDGVASYEGFRAAYLSDPRWKWEDRGGWWRVTASREGRTIEILTNIPVDGREREGIGRRAAILAWLREHRLEPQVVIHRGHSYHLDKTLAELNRTARLAYLGSCGSASKVHIVVERAGLAQVIATRGVGTLAVNDPLLKSINDTLLNHGSIDWPQFWTAEQERFRNERRFAEYIAPHRNEAVILLRAWEQWLAAGSEL